MIKKLFDFLFEAKVPLMPVRHDLLQSMLPAYQETGLPFLLKNADGSFTPLVNADDIGLYLLVPKLMDAFNISLDSALSLFYNGMSIGALIIGSIGSLCLFKKSSQRLIAIAYLLLLTKITTASFDNYRAPAALAIAAIPWALYLLQTTPKMGAYLYLFVLGIAAGSVHYIRSHAGVAPLLFAATLLLFSCISQRAWRQLIFSICWMLAGLAVPITYFKYQQYRYHQFIKTHVPQQTGISQFHGFWHPVLGGLGFLANEFGLSYKDSEIAKKVSERDASWDRESGPHYEQIAKAVIIDLAKKHPWFIINTLAAKAGILLMYLIIFANIGLLALWYKPLPWHLSLAFLLALGWSALPGLLAIPITPYLYGFIAISGLLGLVGINRYLAFS